MKYNGYLIQDRVEDLKQRLGEVITKLSGANKYFESRGVVYNDKDIKQMTGTVQMYQEDLTALAALQMRYNTEVRIAELDNLTLAEAIKRVGMFKGMQTTWTGLQMQAQQCENFGAYGYIDQDEKREYPVAVLSIDECRERVQFFIAEQRRYKRILRVANATELDVPGGLEYLFPQG